jgi:hypothetical protein
MSERDLMDAAIDTGIDPEPQRPIPIRMLPLWRVSCAGCGENVTATAKALDPDVAQVMFLAAGWLRAGKFLACPLHNPARREYVGYPELAGVKA